MTNITIQQKIEEDIKRKNWTTEQWKNSSDTIDRLIYWITWLSPHNLWKAREALRTIAQEARQEGAKEEREKVWNWALENGITHKECFIKLRDFLSPEQTPDPRQKFDEYLESELNKNPKLREELKKAEEKLDKELEQTPKLDEKTQKIMDKLNKKHKGAYQALADVEQTPEDLPKVKTKLINIKKFEKLAKKITENDCDCNCHCHRSNKGRAHEVCEAWQHSCIHCTPDSPKYC